MASSCPQIGEKEDGEKETLGLESEECVSDKRLQIRVCCLGVCMREKERKREREAWLDIFESDKLKSHDVLKLGAEKKGWRERKQALSTGRLMRRGSD